MGEDIPSSNHSWTRIKSKIPLYSLGEILLLVSSTSCSDPRDKVYAVLSLIDCPEWRTIKPDYTKGCGEVFASATFATVAATRTVDALALVRFLRPRSSELPTWAVDFNSEQLPSSMSWYPLRSTNWFYKEFACGQSSTQASISPEFKYLTVTGQVLDVVKYQSRVWVGRYDLEGRDITSDRWEQGRFARTQWHAYLRYASSSHAFLATVAGLIGIGVGGVRQGDIVVLLDGSKMPVILRPDQDSFTFRGLAYIKGIMGGEPRDQRFRDVKLERREFVLH